MVKNFLFLTFCFLFLVSGCAPIGQESLDEITKYDPSFKEVLGKKKELDSRINFLLNQLHDAKTMAYAHIRTIKGKFNEQKRDINSKVSDLKKQLDPERLQVKEVLEILTNTVFTKKAMFKNLMSTKKNLTNLVNQQKTLTISPEDVSKWQEKLKSLNEQIEALGKELITMEKELKISKLKLIALRQ